MYPSYPFRSDKEQVDRYCERCKYGGHMNTAFLYLLPQLPFFLFFVLPFIFFLVPSALLCLLWTNKYYLPVVH
jgi:hypothetical protein